MPTGGPRASGSSAASPVTRPRGRAGHVRARHWPYDRLRWSVALEPAPPLPAAPTLALPNSGTDTLAFDRIGLVRLPFPEGSRTLAAYWLRGYASGLFVPFRDAANGSTTYGAGRYLVDGEERRPRRGSDDRPHNHRRQLRVPAVVRVRPALGLPAGATGEPARPAVEAGERLT